MNEVFLIKKKKKLIRSYQMNKLVINLIHYCISYVIIFGRKQYKISYRNIYFGLEFIMLRCTKILSVEFTPKTSLHITQYTMQKLTCRHDWHITHLLHTD